MTQTALVTRLNNNGFAEVSVLRGTACGGNCHSCGGTCSYKTELTVQAKNIVSAKPGDKVTISSSSSKIIGASALVYILPLITFFLGYGLASLFFAEAMSIVISILAFILGCLMVVLINKKIISKNPITFVITDILS